MGNELSTKRKRRQQRGNVETNEAPEQSRIVPKKEASGADRNGESFEDSSQEKCYDPQDPTLTFVDGEDQLDCR